MPKKYTSVPTENLPPQWQICTFFSESACVSVDFFHIICKLDTQKKRQFWEQIDGWKCKYYKTDRS